MKDQIDDKEIFIGLDCEWVALSGPAFSAITRRVTVPKGVALVQICYGSKVYLFRVHKFTRITFPKKLKALLLNRKIVKVGKSVGGDITRLHNTFGIKHNPSDTCGEVELGGYCRDKDVIERSSISLADICGKVLKHRLPKPNMIRCGDWEREKLTDEQIKYAALDA
jgi:ribonuclease D